MFFFLFPPERTAGGGREVIMYRTPGIQKGPVDSHSSGLGRGSWDGGRRVLYGVGMSRFGKEVGDSQRGDPASVTAQAVVLRKIRTSSLY